jgi:hypothetical protein
MINNPFGVQLHRLRHVKNREGASFPVFPLYAISHSFFFALVIAT